MLKTLSIFAALIMVSSPAFASGTENGIIEGNGACVADANGDFQEVAADISSGRRSEGGFYAEGPGCLTLDIERAYDATHEHAYMKWNAVDKGSEPVRVDSEFDATYHMDYQTTRFFITVKWTMFWNHTVIRDADNKISEVIIEYGKHSGTNMLKHWGGKIHLKAVAPGVTAFAVRNEFDGSRIKRSEVESAAKQLFDKLKN